MIIRKANANDAEALIDLYYNHLNPEEPKKTQDLNAWREKIICFENDPLYHLLVGEIDGRIVSSVTLVAIENLTRNLSPYAVIENVVTHSDFRGNGYAKMVMQKAIEIATELNCYKLMLLTGARSGDYILNFYENCGLNKNIKTAFVKYLFDKESLGYKND